MNGHEIIRATELRSRALDAERKPGTYINTGVLALHEMLPTLSPRWADFAKRRMAFDMVHMSEARVRQSEFNTWRAIKTEIKDYLPKVPADISSLPRGWSRVFSDVMRLYGDPHGK